MAMRAPPDEMNLQPHSAHASLQVDANIWLRHTTTLLCRRRPRDSLEATEHVIRDEAAARGVDVPIAMFGLPVRVEALRREQ